ncbi:hypothetical protein [Brevibacillus sp. VP]|uniref:hypothetical protein n=1 Tax=unclassified Brevibacillus TaxID=2684853 RepID=UPI000E2F40A5|nr:hypothetical protein [Brevibacillus sp. VP]RFB33412.1 hypothetical protein DZB91_14390 [Brevibacillus sp. VP]
MNDFSLELAAEQIKHPLTKEYFKEVLSSYQIGNYRSAIVSLYTVVITDLINKLKDLVDREEDVGAKKILDEIDEERLKDTSLSKWETSLVKKVYEQTKLIEAHDLANIDALKAHRNLSAHPAITSEDLLFTPNKETVRAHIRNMLEGILNKPSMFTHQIVDHFIMKFPALHEQWGDPFSVYQVDYDHIIHKKYLIYFTDKAIKKLFRSLYKLAYRTNSPEAIEHRWATHETLMVILSKYPEIVYTAFSEEKAYYSNISFEKRIVHNLIYFFRKAPRLYPFLDEETQEQLKSILSNDISCFVSSWFISETQEMHYEKVIEKFNKLKSSMPNGLLYDIKELATSVGRSAEYPDFIIRNYSRSSSYTESYELFRLQVRPSLKYFSDDQFNNLLHTMNTNSQIYHLHTIADLIEQIQSEAEKYLQKRIDMSPYKNL